MIVQENETVTEELIPTKVPFDDAIIESLKTDIPALFNYIEGHNRKYNRPYLQWIHRNDKK